MAAKVESSQRRSGEKLSLPWNDDAWRCQPCTGILMRGDDGRIEEQPVQGHFGRIYRSHLRLSWFMTCPACHVICIPKQLRAFSVRDRWFDVLVSVRRPSETWRRYLLSRRHVLMFHFIRVKHHVIRNRALMVIWKQRAFDHYPGRHSCHSWSVPRDSGGQTSIW